MEAANNYWLIWLLYLAAAAIFYPLFWRLTAFRRRRWLSYSLRALLAALILTPWYASSQGSTLAPAVMVAALDAITIGNDAALRASVPLMLALLLAEIVASVLWFKQRRRKTTDRP